MEKCQGSKICLNTTSFSECCGVADAVCRGASRGRCLQGLLLEALTETSGPAPPLPGKAEGLQVGSF